MLTLTATMLACPEAIRFPSFEMAMQVTPKE